MVHVTQTTSQLLKVVDGIATVTSSQQTLTYVTYQRNYFVEAFATFIFLTAILATENVNKELLPIVVGLIVWAVGMGLGGTTGFAMNQARDLGPRLAYQLLPIKNKVNNDWQYGLLVPGTAPFIGAVCAVFFVRYYLGYFYLIKFIKTRVDVFYVIHTGFDCHQYYSVFSFHTFL